MKNTAHRVWMIAVVALATPAAALADFSFGEFPRYVEDQAPDWIFQILSAILIAFSQLLFGMFTGGTA